MEESPDGLAFSLAHLNLCSPLKPFSKAHHHIHNNPNSEIPARIPFDYVLNLAGVAFFCFLLQGRYNRLGAV